MMDFEMIINCKVRCIWTRMRDNLFVVLSLGMWATLVVLFFRMDAVEVIQFFSSFYLAMVFIVGTLLLTWSQYCKTVFRYLTKERNRRARSIALTPGVTARYFCIEERQVYSLQHKKSTLVQHGKESDATPKFFHYHSSTPVLALAHDTVPCKTKRYISFLPVSTAKYFCMEKKPICALQYKWNTHLQPHNEGDVSPMRSNNALSTHAALIANDEASCDRTDSSISPETTANYLCMQKRPLCALQRKRSALIQHGNESNAFLLFQNTKRCESSAA